jgi:uncharacterized phage-associated protein
MFDDRRVAQMAAYLLSREKGRMNHLKLMKLLYLADRESMKRHGQPISGDRFVAMDHGPVGVVTGVVARRIGLRQFEQPTQLGEKKLVVGPL